MKICQAQFAGSSTVISERPSQRLPEFAFIGRSNVGKSSLINMLCGRNRLALTSATPGKTKLVNHFIINDEWYLVDLPGYGYAKLPAKEREKLEAVIRNYLNHSQEMVLLFVLIDCRHSAQKADVSFIRELQDSDIPYALIFTKGDKLGPVARNRQVGIIKSELFGDQEEVPPCFISSSETGLGREEILDFIESILKDKIKTQ